MIDSWSSRIEVLRAGWQEVRVPPVDPDRFAAVKAEAESIIDAGHWTSGPEDLLGVLGRRRDELVHSRVIAWLLVPTNRHGLGRRVLRGLLDHVWPGEDLLARGPVNMELEEPREAPDDAGVLRFARADIVVRGETLCLVIENKVDAGEGPDQCERLYWAFADQADDTRYLFLTRSGSRPKTALSQPSIDAWRSISYRDLLTVIGDAIADAQNAPTTIGRSTAAQYIATLSHIVPE